MLHHRDGEIPAFGLDSAVRFLARHLGWVRHPLPRRSAAAAEAIALVSWPVHSPDDQLRRTSILL
ncbi:hypothetical protein GCM10027073_21590 [Streptomyces chlorus]